MADMPVGALAMAGHARDNVKATTGIFDSSLGALGNARSGVQERQQQRQGDTANFHFMDNLNRAVKHAARCLVDMIPHYYDATRIVRIMGNDGKIGSATINQPNAQSPDPETDEMGQVIDKILHDVTFGEYAITVRAGPSYDTLRQEAVENMVELGGKWPKMMDIAGDKVVAAMDWPGADEIAERIKRTIPPQILGQDGQDDAKTIMTAKGPIPIDQIPKMLEEMDQQGQQMHAELMDAKAGMDKARLDAQTRIEVAEIQAVNKSDVAELQGMIQLLLAKLAVPPILAADVAKDIGESRQSGQFDQSEQNSRIAASPAADDAQSGAAPAVPEPGMLPA